MHRAKIERQKVEEQRTLRLGSNGEHVTTSIGVDAPENML
jgi:hypothetical protein